MVFGDVCFFFFKQKTAYEILRSDWSSDVCSSDLRHGLRLLQDRLRRAVVPRRRRLGRPDRSGVMAQRFGGRFSPGGTAGKATSPRGATGPAATLRPGHGAPLRGRGRRNLLYLAALPLLVTAFRQDAVGMAIDLVAAAVITGAVFLMGEGLKAEDAYAARKVARKP